ncbi:hypothetical protein SLS53_001527 [Cytospora paraplurivora]|uniref:Uncharacterized protein n=1 Tax=Cytospora paraplurivora TaxID=2898453 RepID=A0AAN9YLN0_9PEZI
MPPFEKPSSKGPNMIENFEPLKPEVTETIAAAANRASRRLQHIHINTGRMDAFGYVVSKQWRADSAANRETWAVVRSGLECEILSQGLVSGDASDVPGLAIDQKRIEMVEEAKECENAGLGQLRILQFSTLREFLMQRYLQRWRWEVNSGSPTIVMNFGWGNTDADMAFSCLGVTKLVEQNTGTSRTIMAGIVSSGKLNPFGNGQRWRSIRTQNVDIRSPAWRVKGIMQPTATVGCDERLALVADRIYELGKKIHSGEDERKRILLVMDKPELGTVCETLNSHESSGRISINIISSPSDLGPLHDENIALVEGASYIGRVSNVSDIMVYPYTSAFIREHDQTVFGAGVNPEIHFLALKDECNKLPLEDETSLAHTEHLPQSLHSACLLGRLMVKKVRYHVGLTLESAVIDAIYAIAAVTETTRGLTNLQRAIALVDKGNTGPRKWYTRSLLGVGADQVHRGPIWLAVAIWQRFRYDTNWRGDWRAFEEAITSRKDELYLNAEHIFVSRYSSLDWDAAFERIKGFKVLGMIPPELRGNSRLTRQALLAVDRAMVFAFLDKIVCVQPGDEFLAWDLVSRRKVAEPVDYQWGQVWLDDCLQSDAIEGEKPPVAFFVYTCLLREETRDGIAWRPFDMTYVSFKAVYDVLVEVGDDDIFTTIPNATKHRQIAGMAQGRTEGREVARLADLRVSFRDDERWALKALGIYWPSVPGRDSVGAASAADCMTILFKMIWSRITPATRPKPNAEEDAFACYTWMVFDPDIPGYEELLGSMRNNALAPIKEEHGDDITFEALCRSRVVIDNLWAVPDHQLTYPVFVKGPGYPQPALYKTGVDMAATGFPEWDGVSCPSLEQLTRNVTREERLADGNTLFTYFQSQSVLEVRFTPVKGSKHSLRDIFQFYADSWVVHRVDGPRQEGKQAYMLIAVVKHRESLHGADSIRTLFLNGMEQLPTLASTKPMQDWGFKADECIPDGIKLSLFYSAVSQLYTV